MRGAWAGGVVSQSSENDALLTGVFPEIRADYEAHDKSCVSLRDIWLGRKGGVTCPGDLEDCVDCGVTFYREGVSWLNYDAPDDEEEIHACGCCALKRGVILTRAPYGVTRVTPPALGEDGTR